MSDEILFYHNPNSRAQVAHWMLEEVGAPYRVELVDFANKKNKTAEFLALNPMGKVPTIVHRGVVITEVAAICTYLADAFPKAQLAPSIDSSQRGTYLRWLFFTSANFEAAVMDKTSPRTNPLPSSALGYGSYEDTLATIEKAIQPGPYILGERFSAADVYLGAQLGWCLRMKSIEPRPAFEAYVARMQTRPAMQRMMEQANEQRKQLEK